MSFPALHPIRLLPLRELDPTVFANELLKHDLFPATPDADNNVSSIAKGTFKGTQKAITAAYAGVLNSTASYFDIAGFEPSLPRSRTSLDEAKNKYRWTSPSSDNNPPHLDAVPSDVGVGILDIFNLLRLADTAPLLIRLIPDVILDFVYLYPDDGGTIQALVDRNQSLRQGGAGVYNEANIGDRDDWRVAKDPAEGRFTDAVFSQQQLTGVNPVTLQTASKEWIAAFSSAAKAQQNKAAVDLLETGTYYVQDFSFFRSAIGLGAMEPIRTEDGNRNTGAPVALFQLGDEGKLHIIAICIDFVGPRHAEFGDSVVIFNKRLNPQASTDEATDWPWRYAKTVLQCADWIRHELGVHLTESHFVEEWVQSCPADGRATIVAANRAFPQTHIVYQLLSPHWYKTLSLNHSARTTLLPSVIEPIVGMGKDEVGKFCQFIYKNYQFEDHYVPNDLNLRGFPVEQLNTPKYHNCAYSRNMYQFWIKLREYVSTVLGTKYANDAIVVADSSVKAWCVEMHEGGGMQGFPTITTVEGLIDAVTHCIHIASPLHSAINYLQDYYYSFVINKPPALFTSLPTTLDELNGMTEAGLLEALPAGHAREWLIASHIPWLLSFQVAADANILNWAASIANVHTVNDIVDEDSKIDKAVSDAAQKLYAAMKDLAGTVETNSSELDDQGTPYKVLLPLKVAVSILI